MGSSSSEENKGDSLLNNGWIKYQSELEKDKISAIEPFYTK
jgi:hypothetical protein